MALDPEMIYLVGQSESISRSLFFMALGILIPAISHLVNAALDKVQTKSWAKWCVFIGVALLAVSSLMPSAQTAAAMYVLPAITNGESIRNLPPEMIEIARLWLQKIAGLPVVAVVR